MGLLEKMGLREPPPPPKPSGFRVKLPWSDDNAKGDGKRKAPARFHGLHEKLILKLKDQAATAITGGLSGLLVLLTVYKVISSRESVLAESRKEQQRQTFERKARLAVMRRSLAGPLRSAARDLNTRLREILLPAAPTGEARHAQNYFASHYLEDPEESINTTLYRLCRYLYWVEQLQRGIQTDGELALDDAWQIAVDVRLERVRQALASSDELVDATRARERLCDVIDAAVRREKLRRDAEENEAAAAAAAEKIAAADEDNATDSDSESTPPRRERDENGDEIDVDDEDAAAAAAAAAVANKLSGLYRATSVKKNFLSVADAAKASGSGSGSEPAAKRAHGRKHKGGGGKKHSFKNTAAALGKSAALASGILASRPEDGGATRAGPEPDEPGIRVGRYPLRLFRDTQMAIAEVFGEEAGRYSNRGAPNSSAMSRQMSLGSSGDAKGGSVGVVGGKTSAEPDPMRGERPAGEMLYTDFVIKLEAAMAKGESVNEPWVRWMVPLHLQYHRYASLQARRQKQLTPSEGREVLAARVRLRRVSEALDELLSVLRRRLDDSWFQNNMRKLRKEAMARSSDSHSYHDAVKAAATTAIDSKNRKKGILGGFRTARLWARKAVMREEAIERWDLVRRAVPVVVAEGAAWWEREPPPPRRGRFQIDSAKAMQDVERGFGRVVSDARAAARAVARATAERPARAAAGGAVALFAAFVGARAKRRRGRLTLETISQEMATAGREMSKMAKAAQEELTHVIEDAGRAVDRAVHPHQAPRPPHEQHAASKPNKPPTRVRPPKRSDDPAAAETDPDPEPTPARGMMRRRRAPANEAETRHEDSSSATTDAKASAKASAAAKTNATANATAAAAAAATSPSSSSPSSPSTTTTAPANPSPASANATSSPTESATKDGK